MKNKILKKESQLPLLTTGVVEDFLDEAGQPN